jgi:hypothetical protein
LGFSRTDLAINPHPLVVAWGGPLLGVLIPLIAYGLERLFQLEDAFVFRFYAGFCLVANGAYLGFGSFIGAGDAGDIVRLGSPIWTLWIFGTVCLPLGLWMWHKQGAFFGIGRSAQPIPPRAVLETVGGCVVLLVLGAVIGWS